MTYKKNIFLLCDIKFLPSVETSAQIFKMHYELFHFKIELILRLNSSKDFPIIKNS